MSLPKKQMCLNCKFAGNETIREYEALVCRRYAPRIIYGSGTGELHQNFPVVYGDMWCGEWQWDKKERFKEVEDEWREEEA